MEPFTPSDRDHLRRLGMDEAKALADMEAFRRGQQFSELDRACSPGDGIVSQDAGQLHDLNREYDQAAATGRAMQFVPASGAATRMFKALQVVRQRPDRPDLAALARESLDGNPTAIEFLAWFQGLDVSPFAGDLREALRKRGHDLDHLAQTGDYHEILAALLDPEGLGFADRPKALIPFHMGPDGSRTAFSEHLSEAVDLVRDGRGVCRLHFTIATDKRPAFAAELERSCRALAGKAHFEVGFSFQDPSTDTLAADENGEPFRDERGRLVSRPGGHGALLDNLARCGGDLVFIKNIDNIVPDALRGPHTSFRRAMGGMLVRLQREVRHQLEALRSGPDAESIRAAGRLCRKLGTVLPHALRDENGDARAEARDRLTALLDRPMRVCAMVENRGEPGGGPFWVRGHDGSLTLQIVETPQVDSRSLSQRSIASQAGFFNPTDLVCSLLDPRGKPYDLRRFRDPKAGFITTKSKDGRALRALELPGLWNGSMAHWNTVFMEAPVDIFNPVKSVVDLLRPAHLAANKIPV
ncbi:MAG: DUF4301 family protein [Fibrobacteres bacterium]|nr:DUF4301 family protein [Fibrobacterota bacterium]